MKMKKWFIYLWGVVLTTYLLSCSTRYEDELYVTDDVSYKLDLYFQYIDAHGNNILKEVLPVPTGTNMTLGSSCQLKRDIGEGYEQVKTVLINKADPYLVNLPTPILKKGNEKLVTRFWVDFSAALNSNQTDKIEVYWYSSPSIRAILPSEGRIDKILLNGVEVQYVVKTESKLKVISIPVF